MTINVSRHGITIPIDEIYKKHIRSLLLFCSGIDLKTTMSLNSYYIHKRELAELGCFTDDKLSIFQFINIYWITHHCKEPDNKLWLPHENYKMTITNGEITTEHFQLILNTKNG